MDIFSRLESVDCCLARFPPFRGGREISCILCFLLKLKKTAFDFESCLSLQNLGLEPGVDWDTTRRQMFPASLVTWQLLNYKTVLVTNGDASSQQMITEPQC